LRSTRILAATLLGAATLASPASAIPVPPPHKPARPAESTASPIPLRPVVQTTTPSDETSSGFDWSSAGIGAAGGVGAFAIALAGSAGMRRRRLSDPRPIVTR
jgi:NADPH:quinone reductase-like Zn-dependent oxidoreductase